MRYALRYVLIVAGAIYLQSACMAGEQFRCGQWVVSQEISIAELVQKCGEPTTKSTSSQDILIRTNDGYIVRDGVTVTEVWTYDRGSRAFPMIVTIVDGKVERISRSQ